MQFPPLRSPKKEKDKQQIRILIAVQLVYTCSLQHLLYHETYHKKFGNMVICKESGELSRNFIISLELDENISLNLLVNHLFRSGRFLSEKGLSRLSLRIHFDASA